MILVAFLIYLIIIYVNARPRRGSHDSLDWDNNQLGVSPPLPSDTTLEELKSRNVLDIQSEICINNGDSVLKNWKENEVIEFDNTSPLIRGTTYWINEWMAPGHMMYDIQLLQALQSAKIDQIILQRAPCARDDFCTGNGYWESFFKGLYTAMIDTTNSRIAVYFRFNENEPKWTPKVLGSNFSYVYNELNPPIEVQNKLCFERMLRRTCNSCFHKGISATAAIKFKMAAYNLISSISMTSSKSSDVSKNITITIAHRGLHKRHMNDPKKLLQLLTTKLLVYSSSLNIQLYDTSNTSLTYFDQIKLCQSSNIIIATHGAFIGNVIYMRQSSLLVEIGGQYNGFREEYLNFKMLARNFLVFHRCLRVAGLRSHDQHSYEITEKEMNDIGNIIESYLLNYLHLQITQ